jgi:hypothetical protein
MKNKTVAIISVALVGVILALPATSHAWRRGGRGWGWGPGAFMGGALLGAAIAAPYYAYPPPAYYPPPPVAYTPPPTYGYPTPPAPPPDQGYAYPTPPAASQAVPLAQIQGKGQWVDVPGQMVSNMWVPPHKVWVPDNAPGDPTMHPTGNQPGAGEGP